MGVRYRGKYGICISSGVWRFWHRQLWGDITTEGTKKHRGGWEISDLRFQISEGRRINHEGHEGHEETEQI